MVMGLVGLAVVLGLVLLGVCFGGAGGSGRGKLQWGWLLFVRHSSPPITERQAADNGRPLARVTVLRQGDTSDGRG